MNLQGLRKFSAIQFLNLLLNLLLLQPLLEDGIIVRLVGVNFAPSPINSYWLAQIPIWLETIIGPM